MKKHTKTTKKPRKRPRAQSLAKGKAGEREAAKRLAELFNVEARRGQQYHGGPDTPDVWADIPGVHFEVKRTEELRLWKAMNQAAEDAADNVPVVLHRANGKPWVAIVRLDDLPKLAVQLYLTLQATK
jgi:hypothetical protein